jgi:hypothetical protein
MNTGNKPLEATPGLVSQSQLYIVDGWNRTVQRNTRLAIITQQTPILVETETPQTSGTFGTALMSSLSPPQILRLDSNLFVNLDTLSPSVTLTELYLSQNHLITISNITKLFPNLEILDISANKLENLDEIYRLVVLSSLAELLVFGNPFCQKNPG